MLGLQSELLGMAALGMRHVLPLTGDPSRVGDHPGAASVYDVNSVELTSIIKRLNEGFSQAGKSIRSATGFVIGCTFNPNARNLDSQVNRLERKVAAGAQYAMTQPEFDVRLIEETKKRTQHLNIPIFVGVWPLLSGVQLAKETVAATLAHYDGLYLITPFLKYDTTVELAEFARSL